MASCVCSPDVKSTSSSPTKTGSTSLPSKVLLDTLSSNLKVLCNLSHLNGTLFFFTFCSSYGHNFFILSSELCCMKLSKINGFMENCMEFVISTIPCCLHTDDRFDLTTLCLGLLVNLVEPCNLNRRAAINATISYKTSPDAKPVKVSAIEALTKVCNLFYNFLIL